MHQARAYGYDTYDSRRDTAQRDAAQPLNLFAPPADYSGVPRTRQRAGTSSGQLPAMGPSSWGSYAAASAGPQYASPFGAGVTGGAFDRVPGSQPNGNLFSTPHQRPGYQGYAGNGTTGSSPDSDALAAAPAHGAATQRDDGPVDMEDSPPPQMWEREVQTIGVPSAGLRHRPRGGGAGGADYSLRVPPPSDLDTWVVVFGFPAASDAVSDIERKFAQYGSIEETRTGQGNWVLIRYHTRLQAQKAIVAGNGTLLSSNVMLGVRAVDEQVLTELRVKLQPGQRSVSMLALTNGNEQAASVPKGAHSAADDDGDLLMPRRRGGRSCCDRISSFFGRLIFNYPD